MLVEVIKWVLHRLGFWWFKRRDNTWQKGRQSLMWGGNPHSDEPERFTVTVEWALGKRARFCHASIEFAGEVASSGPPYKLSLAIPRLFAVWVSTDGLPRLWNNDQKRWWYSREIGIKWHHRTLWLNFLSNPMGHDWEFKHRNWKREWHLDFDRLIFGNSKCHTETWGEQPATVIMPEGEYPAAIHYDRRTWTWPRFRRPKVREYTQIELERPPAFAGKGENAWDIDDDGIFSAGYNGLLSPEAAAAEYVKDVLKYRRKYGEPDKMSL